MAKQICWSLALSAAGLASIVGAILWHERLPILWYTDMPLRLSPTMRIVVFASLTGVGYGLCLRGRRIAPRPVRFYSMFFLVVASLILAYLVLGLSWRFLRG